jgi:hypothetical protein
MYDFSISPGAGVPEYEAKEFRLREGAGMFRPEGDMLQRFSAEKSKCYIINLIMYFFFIVF